MPKFKPGVSGNPKGRPPKTEKYARQFGQADKFLAERLLHNLEGLQVLADGGYERIEDKWEPAGLIYIDDYTTGDEGKTIKTKIKAFPNLPEDEMVLVERKRSIADSDRAALINLLDRFLGKPTTPIEATDGDGGPLFKVYLGIDPEQV